MFFHRPIISMLCQNLKFRSILVSGFVAASSILSAGSVPCVAAGLQEVQEVQGAQGVTRRIDPDKKFRFSFHNQEWMDIIQTFVADAGYNFQMRAEQPPSGTWIYHSDNEYTILEAIDVLNQGLRSSTNDPYTLLRYQDMMILIRERDGYPEELIETVSPDELEKRGKYEVMRCQFDLTGMKNRNIVDEINSLFDRGNVRYIESANELLVKGTGERLRTAKSLIERTMALENKMNQRMDVYVMKHVPFEELMLVVRPNMNINQNDFRAADGSITITPQIAGDKVFLKGTEERIQEFKDIAAMVDIAEVMTEQGPADKPFLKIYPVTKDPTLTMQVVQTVMEGRDIRAELGPETGSIYIWARTDDHNTINGLIEEIEGASNRLKVFPVKNRPVLDAITTLQTIFRQSEDETAPASGPIFFADEDTDRLIVRGTPQEIALCETVLLEWDQPLSDWTAGARSTVRIIEADKFQADQIMRNFNDYWPSTNRRNALNIVLPEDRGNLRRSKMMYSPEEQFFRDMTGMELYDDAAPDGGANESPKKEEPAPKSGNEGRGDLPNESSPGTSNRGTSLETATGFQFVSYVTQQEEQPSGVGKTSDEATTQDPDENPYRPADEPKSVPGAPLTIKMTDLGLVVQSEDLDALEDAVTLINELMNMQSGGELPAVFYLSHIRPDQAKTLLDQFLGIESGGGGGGGGLGGMMGGMMNNMIGGAAGDLLGGLFGGGTGDTGSATLMALEGDVTTFIDMRMNSIIVQGATTNDLELISYLIDYIDQPEAPHDPKLLGQTRMIPIYYRDPEELKTMISNHLSDILSKDESAGQGGDAAAQAQAAVMRQIQQAMQGGGGRGGQNSNPDEEKPFAKVSADVARKALVVTGPEYVYNEVLNLVELLDTPQKRYEGEPEMYQVENVDVELLANLLSSMYGDDIVIINNSQNQQGNTPGAPGQPGSNTPGSGQSNASAPAIQFNPGQFLQQMQQRQGGTGGRGGGGGGRGGGGFGGGGFGGGGGGGRGGGGGG